jgi:large subunit ribosomal protein L10
MAVSRAEKQVELTSLEKTFRSADTAVLVDYKGITVPQVTELRRQIKAAGGNYVVVKNTLAKRAAKGTTFESLDSHFAGPTAVVSTGTDPVAIAKAIQAFNKATPVLKVKAAVVQGKAVAAGAVDELASMPSKPELYAKLLYVMNAPAQGLVTVLSGVQRGLVTALSAYAEKKEKGE